MNTSHMVVVRRMRMYTGSGSIGGSQPCSFVRRRDGSVSLFSISRYLLPVQELPMNIYHPCGWSISNNKPHSMSRNGSEKRASSVAYSFIGAK